MMVMDYNILNKKKIRNSTVILQKHKEKKNRGAKGRKKAERKEGRREVKDGVGKISFQNNR